MFSHLPSRDDGGDVNVVIETPRGSAHKVSFDDERGVFVLKKSLPLGMAFPFDFGFIPGTLAGDGDPLDVLLLLDGPAPMGVVVASRLIGAIEAEQTREGETVRNDRLIAVGVKSRLYGHVRSIDELSRELAEDLARFFTVYSTALGKDFRVIGRVGPDRANALLDSGREQLELSAPRHEPRAKIR